MSPEGLTTIALGMGAASIISTWFFVWLLGPCPHHHSTSLGPYLNNHHRVECVMHFCHECKAIFGKED